MKHNKHIFKHLLVALWALALLPSSCRDEQWKEHNKLSEEGAGKSLTEVIRENPAWSKFYEALAATGCDKDLEQSNKFTVFVPENSAWADVNMSNLEELEQIVKNHIAYGKRLSGDTSLYTPMLAMSGKMIRYNKEEGTFNGVTIVDPLNCVAGNGVAHTVDKLIEVKKNIWDYIQNMDYAQVGFIKNLDRKVIDESKIPPSGVIQDTMWSYVNDFLNVVPLKDETKQMTYIVIRDNAYEVLYNKYFPYFNFENREYITKFNVCQDFAFEGIIDITEHDTITNMFDVKVPVSGVEIIGEPYEASNGRVYVIDGTSIRLRDKIKPVTIEGEDFVRSANDYYVFKRYRRWANESHDIQLSCRTRQTDSIAVLDSMGIPVPNAAGKDSIEVRTTVFRPIDNTAAIQATIRNFWIEYKANVNSAPYEIYYVAYDDIGGSITHYFPPDSAGITMRLEQKLFISLPQQQKLSYDKNLVWNNYLGDTICFVGQNLAGPTVNVPAGYKPPLTQLKKWSLTRVDQLLEKPLTGADVAVMNVPQAGELTLWLCNTTRTISSSEQGMLFLDYIKLVPKLPEE